MSSKRRGAAARADYVPVFQALGDETRLSIVDKLCAESPQSISSLTEGTKVTRQAITKHLKVLEGAGIIRGVKRGRENLFVLEGGALAGPMKYMEAVSAQWDVSLARLKAFVEG